MGHERAVIAAKPTGVVHWNRSLLVWGRITYRADLIQARWEPEWWRFELFKKWQVNRPSRTETGLDKTANCNYIGYRRFEGFSIYVNQQQIRGCGTRADAYGVG